LGWRSLLKALPLLVVMRRVIAQERERDRVRKSEHKTRLHF
jgi:hypothetical protein